MCEYEDLAERLADLGIETAENEREALEKALKRAEQTVMNNLNTESVPDELRFAALDIAAGEYLSDKLSTERDRDIESVSEGDFSVSFGDRSSLELLTDRLLCSGRSEMAAYRRIKW